MSRIKDFFIRLGNREITTTEALYVSNFISGIFSFIVGIVVGILI